MEQVGTAPLTCVWASLLPFTEWGSGTLLNEVGERALRILLGDGENGCLRYLPCWSQHPFASSLRQEGDKTSESDEGTALASSLFFILLLSKRYSIPSCGSPTPCLFSESSSDDSGTCWATTWDRVSCGKGGWLSRVDGTREHHSEQFFCVGDPGVL